MEPHSGFVEDLLKNNHSPSDQAVQEAKGFIVQHLKVFEDLDAKIRELESRRDETQTRISQYKSILAPIRRIPPDVLGEIFLRCLPTNRNPIMKSTECPLLLTRICSPWRAVAMLSPRLWERIHITFTIDNTAPDLESLAEMVRDGRIPPDSGWRNAQSKSEKEYMTDVLRRRYEAVKEWLMRSGTRPLSISLSFPSTYWHAPPYFKRSPSIAMEFLYFLATLSPRLRNLELKTSPEIYEVLEHMVKSVPGTPALTSLRIEFSTGLREAIRPILFHAPHLQKLSLATGGHFRIWDINSSIRWNQLTNISYFEELTITQTIVLLQRSSNLVHYKGVISDHADGDTPFQQEDYIVLPFLRSLSVKQFVGPQRIGNLYDRIDAPSLQSVNFAADFRARSQYSAVDDLEDNGGSIICVLPLLQKSKELQKLLIDTDQPKPGDIATLLDAVPTITHLVIGSPDRDGCRQGLYPSLYASYDRSGFPKSDLWGLVNLIVREYSKDDKPLLLPRLKSLVISSPCARINDDTLLDLIKSRMIPGQTVALEHIRRISYRKREKDVEGELAVYAKLVGSTVKLELDYRPPQTNWPMFTDFGLKEFEDNGRSWRYIDAGEDL